MKIIQNFRRGYENYTKFPKGEEKFPKGSFVMEPRQQVFPKGLRKIENFQGGSAKNSKFLRGSSQKPFPKGSKISNLVNRGVWILNGMALMLVSIRWFSKFT